MADAFDEYVIDNVVCPHCQADYGEWCHIASGKGEGRRTQWLHESRVGLLRGAFALGWEAADHYAQERRRILAEVEATND